MLFWIGLLVGMFVGFVVTTYLFRRHYKNDSQRREALRTILYQTHHHGINPICKRIRGITNLGLILTTNRDCDPKSWHEVRNYFIIIEKEALELETTTLDKVKEFEHLT